MTVKVACPNRECGASFSMMPDLLGRNVACKKCGTKFRATGEAPSPDSPDPRDSGRPPEVLPPRIGRYQVIRKLGQGGMGAVYLARDEDLDRLVALKVPHLDPDSDAEVLERFRREARAAAGFRHPNFCPIYEVGQVESRPYLAMAFVEGETLGSRISRDEPMPLREVASIVRQLALALAEAHRQGIIHRDLKPANVMVDRAGTLIIMDFGLARRVGEEDSHLTRTGVPLGTPSYMSPEQVRGSREVGPATDVYALGVILYELATGRRPFEGSLMAIIGAILHVEPLSLTEFRPDLDAELEAICLKAMAKKPEDRYPSMEALAGALGAYLEPPEAGDPPPTRKRPRLLPAAGAFLVLMLGVIVYVATDRGTLKVEGLAADLEVRVDGQVVRIEKVGDPIEVRAGEHGLLVTRGDVVVKAPKSFEVRRGQETVVVLELIDPKPAPDPSPGPARAEDAKDAPAPLPSPPVPPPAEVAVAPKPIPAAREHLDAGEAWLAKGDLTRAVSEFGEAIRLDPTNTRAYLGRAQAWRRLNDLDKALADYDETTRLDPKIVAAYNARGGIWMIRGKPDKALPEFDMTIRLDPKFVLAYFNRGNIRLSKQDYARASADFDEAARLDPKFGAAQNGRAIARRARGEMTEAIAAFDEAIRLDPKSAVFLWNLAWTLATYPDPKYRDGRRAVELATRSCELTSWKESFGVQALAAALAEAGDFNEAVRRQEQAMGLAPAEWKESYREALELYKEGKPRRDENLPPRHSANN